MTSSNLSDPSRASFHVAVVSSSIYSPPWNEGVRNLMHRLVSDFSQRDVRVSIITPKAPDDNSYQESSVRLIHLMRLPEWQGQHNLQTLIYYMVLLLQMSWVVRRMRPKPDVILLIASVTSLTGFRISVLKLASGKPLVLYVTGVSSPRRGHHLGLKADKVIVGSEFLQNWYPNAEIIYPFLPLGVKPDGNVSKEEKSSFTVAFLGSFEPGRGVEYLLQAMALVVERTSYPVRLFIGWNGTASLNYPNIKILIEELGLRHIVEIYGQVDVTKFYRQADVVVIPRLSEKYMSFPVRIVEAMVMQTPLIVTRVCGMENLIEGCGLSVEPGDVDGLANAILEMIQNPTQRIQFSKNCLAALQRFNSQKSLDRIFEILRSHARHD